MNTRWISPPWRRLALAGALAAALPAAAHDTKGAIPDTPGVQAAVAVAAAWLHADQTLPATKLPGVLGIGDTPGDQRGWRLEHGTLALGLRLSPQIGTEFALGWHDKDPAHVEAAWVALRPQPGSDWSLGGGRGRVPVGPVLDGAGHFDRFAHMPLAKRSAFNGDWIEDGLNLRWQPHLEGAFAWLESVDLGVWKMKNFPGSEAAPWASMLHIGARWGDLGVDAFATRIRPKGRGAYVQRENSGHIHTAPRCDASLRDISCMDGTVDLAGTSLRWDTPLRGVQLSAAATVRRERGALYSSNGDARYSGRYTGGWLEAVWQPNAQWELGLRQEWLQSRANVAGPGASLVAADANLLPSHPARRSAAMLGWRPSSAWLVALEAGRERVGARHNGYAGLRVLWTPEPLRRTASP